MTDVVSGTLQVDLKRRTTLPADVLAAAGIPPGSTLVARVEEPGRIVLESPQLLLTLLQDDIAAALNPDPAAGAIDPVTGELTPAGQLGIERVADTSLEGPSALRTNMAGVGEPGAPTPGDVADEEGRV